MMKMFLLLVCISLLIPFTLEARTWHVRQDGSGDCTAIQACIALASSGDTVLVGPGTYSEHLVITLPMTLIGEAGALQTTIDGGGGLGRCITCSHPSGRVHVEGLTLTGGSVPSICPPNNTGGGIVCVKAELEVRDCRILANTGGGVGCRSGTTVFVTDCEIADNIGWMGDPCSMPGDGITGDHATGTVVGCTIHNHQDGAGIGWSHGTLYASENKIYDGGGVSLDFVQSATVSRNVITNCRTAINGDLSYLCVTSNTIVNSAQRGVSISDCTGSISYNIVASNGFYGIDCDHTVTLYCNDVWNNTKGNYAGACPHPSDISADPLFCNPLNQDYTLGSFSPCANAPGCGQIGAFSVGCSPTGVNEKGSSWGRVKALFR